MPDIQSELSKVLNEWDKPIEEINQPEKQMETTQGQPSSPLFRTTNNVTRATFNVVKDNAGITRKEAITLLDKQGYGTSSTATLLSQMIKQRLIRMENDGKLYANFAEYVPLKAKLRKILAQKNPAKIKEVKRAYVKRSVEPKEDVGIAALQPQAARTAIITTNFSVDSILKNLTIMQAKELRDALNNLFK